MLNDTIIQNEFGVALENTCAGRQFKHDSEYFDNNSQSEDFENHFHITDFVKDDVRLAFLMGIMTIMALSDKFINSGFTDIRFWYSFQSPEMGLAQDIACNMEPGPNFISDRLSFYTIRNDEYVIDLEEDDESLYAKMWIDI